jgi:predicted O-methyltransferase YrrM
VYELTTKPHPLHHGHAISIDMAFSATWAAKEGWISADLRDRVHAQFRRAGLSRYHECFTAEKLHYGTTTIMQRRDGDLYAAIPHGEIGKCAYIMQSDPKKFKEGFFAEHAVLKPFETREELDTSLESALVAHRDLMANEANRGVGVECFITEGFHRGATVSKLELGTWSERLEALLRDMGDAQSFVSVNSKAANILRLWDMTTQYMQDASTPLREPVLKILKASALESPFPAGMDMNWALDIQSAQTLDFLASMHSTGKVAWDLGTFTGVSAAVLSQHMKVVTVEREPTLAKFARKHLPKNVRLVEGEICAFLRNKAADGKKADFIFMDLDKPLYAECYEIIMSEGLLQPGGVLLCDNVLYRGLTAQHRAGELPAVSERTAMNAQCMDGFVQMVQKDLRAGYVTGLMMPVRDGMLAVKMGSGAPRGVASSSASTASSD